MAFTYYVYILVSGRHGTLYIGATNNLRTRLEQHRAGRGSQFVKRYNVYGLRGDVRLAARSNGSGEAVEKLATRLENSADRNRQSGLERFIPFALDSGGYGPRPPPGRQSPRSSPAMNRVPKAASVGGLFRRS